MKQPSILASLIPLLSLVVMVSLSISFFGSSSLEGANQISLLFATAVCCSISMSVYKVKWKQIEQSIAKTIGESSVSIVILLLIGMMSAAWMISGIVPMLIYYGIQILTPSTFLLSSCVICSVVSVMTGSSWTTVATIGVALLGIGEALTVPEAWTAGAIISGSYFGDKISPMSDTTVLASSAAKVNIFEHIRYMLNTTVPTYLITLVVFFFAGFFMVNEGSANINIFLTELSSKFHISLWNLIVPLFTALLIIKKVPALITLFVSSVLAGIMAVILQPGIIADIAGSNTIDASSMIKGVFLTFFSSTNIQTNSEDINELISTGGMSGMLDTVWLILCAMCFGGAMTATGMLQCIVRYIVSKVRGIISLASCTAATGISLNLMTSDQYMSIVLTADMYREVYNDMNIDRRLLSRTTEDSTTVTSVLIPWNTCGMTQSTILGVATLEYLPYCFFNYLSPLMTIFITSLYKNTIQNTKQAIINKEENE